MRVLIPTAVHPTVNSSLIILFRNILRNLEKRTNLEPIWFLYTSKKLDGSKFCNDTIISIHNYKDATEVLKNLKPDCVLANNNKHYAIDYAFSIAARSLQIPLIHYKVVDLAEDEPPRSLSRIADNFRRNFKQFFSVDHQNKDQKRRSFIIYKNRFLSETKRSLGFNSIEILKSQWESMVFHFIGEPSKRFTNLADLQLVGNEIWMNVLQKAGIDKMKLVLTGNPYWDELFNIIKKLNLSKEPITRKPLRLLVLTSPMVEHGYWTTQKRENFLQHLLIALNNNEEFSLSIKIHPATENLDEYENIIKKIGLRIQIYQKESFWNIAENFDIIVSYGYTTTHSECALVGYRMIIFEGDWKVRQMPLVNTAVDCGFIRKCHAFNDLSTIIKDLAKTNIEFDKSHREEIEKILYKFDGKSGERAADAIMKLING